MDRLIGAYWLPQTTLTFLSPLLLCCSSLCICNSSLLALCALFCASLATWRSDCDQQPSKFQDHSFVKLAFRASLAEIAQQKCNSCAPAELVFGGPGQAPLRPGPSGCAKMDAAPKPATSNRRLLAPTLNICFLHLVIEEQNAENAGEE